MKLGVAREVVVDLKGVGANMIKNILYEILQE